MDHPITIHDLPIELLLSIFRLSFAVTNLQQDRCRLSLVCRYWRDIVQESPYLWTEISGNDDVPYIRRSIAKSGDLPIDVYYLGFGPKRIKTHLPKYLEEVIPQLSRCRSISLQSYLDRLDQLLNPLSVGLDSAAVPYLEGLSLEGSASHRSGCETGAEILRLPAMTAFPKLHRLDTTGLSSKLCHSGLPLNRFLSLSLIDIINLTMEQLLDVLQNSPSLERLELGRSPTRRPSQPTVTPIHLPRLMALHLIFMPVSVSNYLLSTIHAPNCSELLISSDFPESLDDVVGDCLFTRTTEHFFPVMRTLLTCGRHKDIDISRGDAQRMALLLKFHDDYCDDPLDHGPLRLHFRLHSVQQVEHTVRWLVHYLEPDMPKISIRLYMDRFEEVHLMDLFDSHMTVTHFALRIRDDPDAIRPHPILTHMARPTFSRWPLPEMVDFVYGIVGEDKLQDEAAQKMLQDRYGSSGVNSGNSSDGPSNGILQPKPLKRIRIVSEIGAGSSVLGEVEKILPGVASLFGSDDESLW
ncbi:hypothetical protein FS837_009275 [Tulasnella sp. UAMH 9824]|nr:hypothetical protein FS837_009275 [Tulasnella sp. UAMH 9824]